MTIANKQINAILTLKDKISQPLVKVSKNVNKVTREMKYSQNQINEWGRNAVKSIDKVIKKTIKWGAATTAAVTGIAVKTAIDLEDAFSGVRKTVDATEEEFAQIRESLNNLAANEIPIAVDKMYGIAEMAGQLGIAKENIVDFTDTMAKLAIATNMTEEQASTSLARLANITQMPQTEFDKLGSVIVELGNNLATTESEIVEMGLRLAGTASQVGLTEAQILALAGAMSSVGINAEAGGSSMSRVMQKINTEVLSSGKNLKGFAKIAGWSAKDFADIWGEDPQQAINDFIIGLDKIAKNGGDVTTTLKNLGINSVQEIDTLLRLSGASNVLVDSFKMANQAWAENTALQAEAEEKFKNTKSQLQLLKNNLTLAADELGQVFLPYINDAVQAAIPFIQKLKESKDSIKEVVDQIMNFIKNAVTFITKHEKLITTIGAFVLGMYTAIKAIRLVTTVMTTWITISQLLNGTLKMSTLGWLVIAIGAVVAAGYALYRNWDLIKEKAKELEQRLNIAFTNIATGIVNVFKGIGNFFISYVINPIIRGLNAISFKVPDWVPGIGGKTFGFNLKELGTFEYGSYKSFNKPIISALQSVTTATGQQLSSFAKGTSYSPAGYARIHEEGGEIRKLSSGETIIPADKSERLLRNKSLGGDVKVEVNVYGNIYGDDEITNKVGNEIYKKVKLALDNM